MRLKCLFVKIDVAAVLILAVLLRPPQVGAAPITIDSNSLRNFRDNRTINDVGVTPGDRNVYGADVSPNVGTTITAVQGNRVDGPTLCNGNAVDPNNCTASIGFNPNRNGSWALTFGNGADTATAVTPALDPAALLGPVPFPQNVAIVGTGVAPTLSWTIPSGFIPDAVRVRIYDKAQTNQRGQDVIIFSQPLPGNQTSFTIPNGILQQGAVYVLNVQLIETRGHVDFSSDNGALIARRSSSFFDFTPLPPGSLGQAAFLPMVGPAPNPSTGLGAAYQFDVGSVGPNSVTFIDPFVAVGYDYATGPGDPNFASVILPAIQTEPFLLSFPDQLTTGPVKVFGNKQFFFPSGGVSQFSIRGINIGNNLDPSNVTAFITGLTFVTSGQFTGTMTPVLLQAFCSSLGDDPKPSLLDQDIYTLQGTKGEELRVRLEELKDDNKSNQASLILLDNIQGAILLKTDNGTLPNEVSAVLPATGEYLVVVAEQPLIARGNRFRGDYCLSVRSSAGAAETLQPTGWVEQ